MGFFQRKGAEKGANQGKAAHAYVPEGHGHTDEQIRADVHERLVDEQTARFLSVVVQDGVVTLGGEITSEPDRLRLLSIVRAIPSVMHVEDRLRINRRPMLS